MPKKRKQKQYTKQFELDAEIIRLKRLAERKEVKALEWDAEFHVEDSIANDPGIDPGIAKFHYNKAGLCKKKAITLRQQINGIVMRRIPNLIIKKAELATKPLPGFDPEMGVAA